MGSSQVSSEANETENEDVIKNARNDQGKPQESDGMTEKSTKDAILDAAGNVATQVATTLATAGTAIEKSINKAVEKLDEDKASDLGPYQSPATCLPGDIDPVAGAVHGGLELDKPDPGKHEKDAKEISQKK